LSDLFVKLLQFVKIFLKKVAFICVNYNNAKYALYIVVLSAINNQPKLIK